MEPSVPGDEDNVVAAKRAGGRPPGDDGGLPANMESLRRGEVKEAPVLLNNNGKSEYCAP